ncbi:bacterial regulatory helix-turn-helix, lysR family protein [Collimonas arenae]|nr:bacterial regulatory helix-turn-helix, lysR family protein [Collimonas arenae]
MTLTELKYIVAVARVKHFGHAAEACFVAQPTLSVAIKKLEDELGVVIFERGGTEISVTPLGAQIVAQAERVLEQTATIREIANQNKDPLAGPLRLGIIYTVGPYLLPPLVKTMIEQVPQMPLVLQENFTVRLLELLRQGELDAAIIALPFPEHGLMVQPLYDEPFVVALPKHHAWANRESISAEDLKSETMLLLGNGHCFRDQVLEVCPEMSRYSTAGDGIARTFEGRRWRPSGIWWHRVSALPYCRKLLCPTWMPRTACCVMCRSLHLVRRAASSSSGARVLPATPPSKRCKRRCWHVA